MALVHFSSQVEYKNKLPSKSDLLKLTGFKTPVLLYDSVLNKHEFFNTWLKRYEFTIKLKAGEGLKSFSSAEAELCKISKLLPPVSRKNICFVAIGGGSTGDFAGFLASIYKRGVGLIHIPSTWLAALDSAHGGKSALNLTGHKNQVGTFYPAKKVFIVKSLLQTQPKALAQSAMGEFSKYCLLNKKLFEAVSKSSLSGEKQLWKFLPQAIDIKYKVVLKDPYELKGLREVLNLGHTVGHVIESYYRCPHGEAVMQGLMVALEVSNREGVLSQKSYKNIVDFMSSKFNLTFMGKSKMPAAEFLKIIKTDKKVTSKTRVNFVLLKSPGQVLVKPVSFKSILAAAQKTKWVKK